jgi:hypothetical protein
VTNKPNNQTTINQSIKTEKKVSTFSQLQGDDAKVLGAQGVTARQERRSRSTGHYLG